MKTDRFVRVDCITENYFIFMQMCALWCTVIIKDIFIGSGARPVRQIQLGYLIFKPV